jgi:NAD(P)-dependent dehydrogenase (short-subunit alcohol dehydrogenase family)
MVTRTLAGRVAVVTGAARGIGNAVARAYLEAGCSVAALDRTWESTGLSGDDAERVRAELESRGAFVATADVTDDRGVADAAAACLERFGTVHIVVNNAAMRMRDVDPRKYVEVLDGRPEQWMRMFDVNVLGPLRVIQALAPTMVAQGDGAIINVSSSSGTWGMAGDNPYGATKAALTNLSQSLAAELRPAHVAVSIVFPAITRTTGFAEQHALHPSDDPTDGLPVLRPESVGPLAVWLAEQGDAVSGQTFSVVDWLVEHGLGPIDEWLAEGLEARNEVAR